MADVETGCWRQFAAAIEQGPVLFAKDETSAGVLLYAGHEEFSLKPTEFNGFVLASLPITKGVVNSSQKLGTFWTGKGKAGKKLGFCSSTFVLKAG